MIVRPTTLDPERTRTEIIRAALELFLERGFAGASLSAIAEQAGVAKSLIHHHFGSKKELWTIVKRHTLSEYLSEQGDALARQEPDLELIVSSMRIYFRFMKSHPEFARLGHWMDIEGDECEPGTIENELTVTGVRSIREGQARGVIRDDIEAELLLAAFFCLTRHWFQGCSLLDADYRSKNARADLDERYLEAILKIFTDGAKPSNRG